jgi:hypothetical protein
VEVAKKEKERRAKLKGKSGKVITNEDLKKVKKHPDSVTNEDLKKSLRDQKAVTNEDLNKGQRQPSVSVPSQPESKEEALEKTEAPEAQPTSAEPASPDPAGDEDSYQLKSLEQTHEKAKTQVEMLLNKMNALFVKYYSPDNTTPEQMIQSEISRTALQLQKARDDEKKAKKALEDFKSKKRDSSLH